jgi:hypothetical protein
MLYLSSQEITDQWNHFVRLVFQCEMARVEQVKFDIRKIAFIRICAICREDDVILPPDDQHRRPMLPEIRLNGRIKRKIGSIVEKEIELDVIVARAIQ